MVSVGALVREVDLSLSRITLPNRSALEISEIASYEARGHRVGDPTALYGSDGWSIARSEFLHHHPALKGGTVRHTILTGRLRVLEVVDDDVARELGTTIEDLTAEALTACQDMVSLAFRQGAEAVRLPSARGARHETNVIVQRSAALASLEESTIEYRRL